jgi:hypothetical protein
MVTHLTWSDSVGKRVRQGRWSEQAVSTTHRIADEVRAGRFESAAQLIDYWMEEAKVVQVIYESWSQGWLIFLQSRGVSAEDIDMELARLGDVLAFPDGEPFTVQGHWQALSHAAGELAHQLRALHFTAEEALGRLDDLREAWRQQHDRGADLQSGLLTFTARRFGEASLGEAYEHVLGPYLEERYQVFDLRERTYEETLERNVYLAFEAMRGHLVGPDRTGDMTVTEDDDKIVIAFDPCGSGNRGQRGDPFEGTPSRSEEPYSFGVTQDEHDWAWNEKGVCYYCAHCCYALEYWPAQQWGHPVRVVDSPLHPDETTGEDPKQCTWTIYKSLEAIPDTAYHRIGRTKPQTP